MFLTNAPVRQDYGAGGAWPVMVWLNLDSKDEVDELFRRWREAGATILDEPEDKPWRLREFRVAEPGRQSTARVLRLCVGVAAESAVGRAAGPVTTHHPTGLPWFCWLSQASSGLK
jgi:hypothetical protein